MECRVPWRFSSGHEPFALERWSLCQNARRDREDLASLRAAGRHPDRHLPLRAPDGMEGARHSNSEPHERTCVDMDTFMTMISLLFPSQVNEKRNDL
jgi:hypothetical protein